MRYICTLSIKSRSSFFVILGNVALLQIYVLCFPLLHQSNSGPHTASIQPLLCTAALHYIFIWLEQPKHAIVYVLLYLCLCLKIEDIFSYEFPSPCLYLFIMFILVKRTQITWRQEKLDFRQNSAVQNHLATMEEDFRQYSAQMYSESVIV